MCLQDWSSFLHKNLQQLTNGVPTSSVDLTQESMLHLSIPSMKDTAFSRLNAGALGESLFALREESY